MNTTIIVGQSMTITAAEMYQGSAAVYTLPLLWTVDNATAATLTPSSDTLSCVVKCTALSGSGAFTLHATSAGPSALINFSPVLGVDTIVLSVS